jgi:trimethylamine monooxygenase
MREVIEFNTLVINIEETEGRQFDVTVHRLGEEPVTTRFDYVAIGTGHHSKPWIPNNIDGLSTFPGRMLHSHNFRESILPDLVGKAVMIVGSSFSGADIIEQIFLANQETGECPRKVIN